MESTIIMLLALGVVYYATFFMVGRVIKSFRLAVIKYRINKIMRKSYKKYVDRREEMLSKGEMHEYVTIQVLSDDNQMIDRIVCKKTGWCPSIKDYYAEDFINKQLRNQQMQKDYKIFRDDKVKTMSDKYGISEQDLEKVVADVFDIKKQFQLEYMDKKTKEIDSGKS